MKTKFNVDFGGTQIFKPRQIYKKKCKMADMIIILNLSGLNTPIKRQRITNSGRKKAMT